MKKIFKIVPFIIIAVLVGVTAVYASPDISKLSPTGNGVTDAMYSLQDIYNLATDGKQADAKTGNIALTPDVLSNTGVTLTEVYNAVSTAISQTGGADLSNMFNGSSTTVDGGSQADGGIDDANYDLNGVPQTPPLDRYKSTWEQCIESNDYCGTDTNNNQVNDSGANAKDLATGLVWSYPLKDAGGATFDTAPADVTGCDTGSCAYQNTDTTYSWDSSNANNDTGLPEDDTVKLTAQELCSQHTGWSLPHQKQLMQAYIDGAYGNGRLDTEGVDRHYWSATTNSDGAGSAWGVYLSHGSTYGSSKDGNLSVRCIRE